MESFKKPPLISLILDGIGVAGLVSAVLCLGSFVASATGTSPGQLLQGFFVCFTLTIVSFGCARLVELYEHWHAHNGESLRDSRVKPIRRRTDPAPPVASTAPLNTGKGEPALPPTFNE